MRRGRTIGETIPSTPCWAYIFSGSSEACWGSHREPEPVCEGESGCWWRSFHTFSILLLSPREMNVEHCPTTNIRLAKSKTRAKIWFRQTDRRKVLQKVPLASVEPFFPGGFCAWSHPEYATSWGSAWRQWWQRPGFSFFSKFSSYARENWTRIRTNEWTLIKLRQNHTPNNFCNGGKEVLPLDSGALRARLRKSSDSLRLSSNCLLPAV